MVFRKLAGVFGVGGPSVETVLMAADTFPGGCLAGEVQVRGGEHDVTVHGVVLSLVTRVETEYDEHESDGSVEFHRGAITGPFHLAAGQHYRIPFEVPIPWELPITEVHGHRLHGMTMGLGTELEVAGTIDPGDLDSFSVHPLPSQQRVLDAFAALGFELRGADIEQGHIAGLHQELPFYQEIEFHPPAQYRGRVNEVELTFVADPDGLAVILEADVQGGFTTEGHDATTRLHLGHDEALRFSWESHLATWLQTAAAHPHTGHGHHHWATAATGGLVIGLTAETIFDEDDEEAFEEALEEALEESYEDDWDDNED